MSSESGLEIVHFTDRRGMVTVQVALHEKLAVPMTVSQQDFWAWPNDDERHEWLKRCARTLLDIFGDARDSRVLSDFEVQERASA